MILTNFYIKIKPPPYTILCCSKLKITAGDDIDIRFLIYGIYYCPECYSKKFAYHSGNIYCTNCGLVVYNEEQEDLEQHQINFDNDLKRFENYLKETKEILQ